MRDPLGGTRSFLEEKLAWTPREKLHNTDSGGPDWLGNRAGAMRCGSVTARVWTVGRTSHSVETVKLNAEVALWPKETMGSATTQRTL